MQVKKEKSKQKPFSKTEYELKKFGSSRLHVVRHRQVGENKVSIYCGKLTDGVSLASRTNAKIVVNGTFYNKGNPRNPYPIGAVVVDGKIKVEPDRNIRKLFRPCFAVHKDGTFSIIDGIKSIHTTDLNSASTEDLKKIFDNDETWAISNYRSKHKFKKIPELLDAGISRKKIHLVSHLLSIGSSVRFEPLSAYEICTNGKSILHLIGGGLWLVKDGKIVDGGVVNHARRYQGFSPDGGAISRTANRTAIGIRGDGTLILIVSEGMTLSTLAKQMLYEGVENSMSVDGGGSAQIVSRTNDGKHFRTRNRLEEGTQRKQPTFIIIE